MPAGSSAFATSSRGSSVGRKTASGSQRASSTQTTIASCGQTSSKVRAVERLKSPGSSANGSRLTSGWRSRAPRSAAPGVARLDEAIAITEDALRISPAFKGVAPWATLLARIYLAARRLDDAAAAVERALRCDPTFFPAHLTAALVASRRGDESSARRHAEEAHRIRPDLDASTLRRIVGSRSTETIQQVRAGAVA